MFRNQFYMNLLNHGCSSSIIRISYRLKKFLDFIIDLCISILTGLYRSYAFGVAEFSKLYFLLILCKLHGIVTNTVRSFCPKDIH